MENLESLAEGLFIKYSHMFLKVADLFKDASNTAILAELLLFLEKQGRVYVQRRPVLHNSELRKDILSQDVVYFGSFPSIKRRTLLYKTGVEYGDYTINHVLGCAHGCTYPCYAMNISKRYGRVTDYDDWMRPRIVENALELLENEISKYHNDMNFVHLSFMTDPFMYDPVNLRNNPWIENLTLEIIEKLNSHGIKCTVLTKSKYPTILTQSTYSRDNEYGITLVSLSPEFHSQYEPYSPEPFERIKSLRNLHDSGLKTWVSLEPYPTPNIINQDIVEILNRIDFVDKIIFGKWNYSALVNGYKEQYDFYRECSDRIIEFAKQKGIPYHIKNKTPRSTQETETIFRK